jgi:vesicle transport protein SEC22
LQFVLSMLLCSDLVHPAFSYLISENVVFLTIADKSYPRKLAFSYLDELSKEFANTYGPKVEAVRKPYAFVGFGV